MEYQVYQDEKGKWWWRAFEKPEGDICHSVRGYVTEEDCHHRIKKMMASSEAKIVSITFIPDRPHFPTDDKNQVPEVH